MFIYFNLIQFNLFFYILYFIFCILYFYLYFYFQSFSDYNFGWAFYGIGQLRHSNNATGEIYGKKFKKTGVLGVFLDMDKVN